MSMKNSSDTIGNRTRAVSQPTVPPRASLYFDKEPNSVRTWWW